MELRHCTKVTSYIGTHLIANVEEEVKNNYIAK